MSLPPGRDDPLLGDSLEAGVDQQEQPQGGGQDGHRPQEEDHERDAGHLLPLRPAHGNHLRHHFLQALLLRGRPQCKLDHHAGDDHHLHQRDGEASLDLLPKDDRLLADLLPGGESFFVLNLIFAACAFC